MKKIILPLVLITALLSACKDNIENVVQWKVNTSTFNSSGLQPTDNTQIMSEAGGGSLQIFIKNKPTDDGDYSYTVVDESKAAHGTLADDEVAVEINVGASDVYLSTGLPANSKFIYTIRRNGHSGFTVPDIQAVHSAGSGVIDTATISASWYQTGSN